MRLHGVGKVAGVGFRHARRGVVFVLGASVVLFGLVLVVTPGPAFLVIPAGLAILAFEFEWARRWLHRAREEAERSLERASPRQLRVTALFSTGGAAFLLGGGAALVALAMPWLAVSAFAAGGIALVGAGASWLQARRKERRRAAPSEGVDSRA